MIMPRRIAKLENDRYLRIETFHVTRRKIPGRIEYQPVNAGGRQHFFRNQISNPAILVSGSFANQLPAARCLDFQSHRHACGGPPL